jgi:hypothetical protein
MMWTTRGQQMPVFEVSSASYELEPSGGLASENLAVAGILRPKGVDPKVLDIGKFFRFFPGFC